MLIRRIQLHQNIRFFSLLGFVISLPIGHSIGLLVNNISIMLLALNWLLESSFKEKGEMLKRNKSALIFVAYYLAHITGMLYSDNLPNGIFQLEKKLNLLFLPIIFASSEPISTEKLRQIFKTFVWSCLVAAFVCVAWAIRLNYQEGQTLSYLYHAILHDVHTPDKYAYFNYWYFTYKLFSLPIGMHPIYFSMYLVFCACLIVHLWWDKTGTKKRRNLLVYCALFFIFCMVVLLSSRMQLFLMVVFGTGFVLYQGYLQGKLLRGIVVIVVVYGVGLSFVLLNPVIRERIISSNKPGAHFDQNKYGEGGLSLRTYKWKYTQQAIWLNPIFGTGTGDAQDELQKIYAKNNFEIGVQNEFNPHNQILQSTLELGIFGFLAFLAIFIYAVPLAIKSKSWIYLCFLLLFFISCLTESMLEVNKGIAFFSFFNVILMCSFNQNNSSNFSG